MKIYNRLAELGFLTPDEVFEAHESNKLPKIFESEENQERFKKQRERGLYEPVSGSRQEAGRPEGTPQKQKEKETTPVGASVINDQKFSISKFKDTLHDLDGLVEKVTAEYKKKFGIKRISKKHKSTIESITFSIVASNKKEDWGSKVEGFLQGTHEIDEKKALEVEKIKETHQLSNDLSALMYHCEFLEENSEEKV